MKERKSNSIGIGEPAVAFWRVSTPDQKEFSLPAQAKAGSEYVERHGLKIVEFWSEAESASKETERKIFFKMVAYVKEHGIKNVIFDKVDRAVRGFKSAVIVEELVEAHGVRFHFTRENLVIDSSSPPSDKLRFYLSTVLGKYYIDNLKVEINKGVAERLEEGHWCWKAPVGYKNIRDPGTKQSRVFVDPLIGPVVTTIFERYSTGNYLWTDLIKLLNAATGKNQDYKFIGVILKNPFYYGEMLVKGKLQEQSGKHKPLIDKATWDKCQKIRGIRAQQFQSNPRARQEIKPFMGLIRCGKCEHQITGETKSRPNGKIYIYYRCANHDCAERSSYIRQEKLHEQIVAAFKPFERFTPKATEVFVETTWGRLDDLDAFTKEEIGKLNEKKTAIKDDMRRFYELKGRGQITAEEYAAFVKAKESVIDEIDVEIGAYATADSATYKKGLGIIELFTNIPKIMGLENNLMVKARLAEIVLSNKTLLDGTLRFDYEKPFDDLLKLAGSKVWW